MGDILNRDPNFKARVIHHFSFQRKGCCVLQIGNGSKVAEEQFSWLLRDFSVQKIKELLVHFTCSLN